jgi:Skp family chaperone for outer membrane proteins
LAGRAAPVKDDRLQQQGALNVKKSYLAAALAASVVVWGLLGSRGAAQQPARVAAPTSIALVDVTYIFKNHPRYKAMMDELKGEVERAEARWKAEAEKIKRDAERIQDFRAGTPDYKNIEEDVVRKQSDLQARIKLEQKDLMQREAKIHFNVYQEILQEVTYYCQTNNIGVVVRFNGDPVNAEKPDDILRGMNQQVIYYHKDLDITPIIMKRFTARPATGGPIGVRPGVGAPAAPAGNFR